MYKEGLIMNDLKFKNIIDLYNRLLPALKSKARELHKVGLKYIHEEDIWNYLKEYKWERAIDLDLARMVNDIFNIKNKEIEEYMQELMKEYRRKITDE